jgi:His-Xaa-Ser system radical SAM maturase HxsB
MNKEIAKKAVDIALQSPSMNLTFEFQGGEPLANFEVLKYIVNYSKERNKELGKDICYSMVSNLTLLNEEMINFILENNIGLSTSIDGPEAVHNVNRKYNNGNSLEITKSKMKLIKDVANSPNVVQAIQTTSKFSLNYPKEIVDEYVSLGLKTIFVRPLTPMGYAAKYWGEFGYTADEYLDFYEKTLDYIIELASKGINISEANAVILLKKILNNDPINYMELRSPCGGAIGQLAYNYDGNIYTCDEGRMLAEMGDESFKLGNVFENSLKELIKSPACKTVAVSSCLEAIPGCEQCVYSPYCGVCPVCNYAQYGNLFAPNINSYRCRIYKGMLKILFEKINKNNENVIEIFHRWVE